MEILKDVFVSYGRAESKAFAIRLHNELSQQGYNVWLDQNDIPLAVDFQNQIDAGIESADNFIFIIAPHSLQSEYCRKEIETAIKYNKRIIPILHIEPETKEFWDMMHPVVSKINWVYFREKFDPAKPQQEYETIDDFEESFKGLISILNHQKSYVRQHTLLLQKAKEWERNQRSPSLLLVGSERTEADKWLHTDFKTSQPPTTPTDLQCEYIAESKKNANNMMTEVFFCYAEEDREILTKIKKLLTRRGLTTWTDISDIKTGIKFKAAIEEGIEQADNFVFLISPDSVVSKYCLTEIDHALKYKKRIIPLYIKETDESEIPPKVRAIQYLNFTSTDGEDFKKSFDELLAQLNSEREYFHQHKVLLTQALKWEKQKHNPSILLRGHNLQQAEAWLKIGANKGRYRPLPIHKEFITESRNIGADLTTEIFISYSRNDSDFARRLNDHLQIHGKTTWFDQESIASGTDFQKEIYNGIESSDNFLFVITPKSITSAYCTDEVEYARKYNKRFITILLEDVDEKLLHNELAKVQWINFKRDEQDFQKSFSELLRTLDTDREHVKSHNKWLHRAMEWEKSDKNKDQLLRGLEFEEATRWLKNADEDPKPPLVSELQREYIKESHKAILEAQRAEKRRTQIKQAMLVVMTILFIMALILGIAAFFAKEEAQKNEKLAIEAKEEAIEERRKAEREKERAEREKERAEKEKERADNARLVALRKEEQARQAEALAERRRKEAELAKQDAEEKRRIAEQAKIFAEQKRKEADSARSRAQYHLYTFNAKEFANKSINMQENHKLRALLALTAYELKQTARELAQKSNYPKQYDTEILEALQKAYFLFTSDQLYTGESWVLDAKNQHIAFSDKMGRVLVTRLTESVSNEMPGMKVVTEGKKAEKSFIRDLQFNHEGNKIVYGTANGDLILLDIDNQSEKKIVKTGLKSILSLSFLPSTNDFVALSAGKIVKKINLNNNKIETISFPDDIQVITGLSKNQFLAANNQGKIFLFNLKNVSNQQVYQHNSGIYTLCYHQDLDWLLAGCGDGKILLFKNVSLETQTFDKPVVLPLSQKGIISAITFSPDKNWMATSSLDGTVFLWNLNDIKKRQVDKLVPIVIENNQHKIFSLTFDEKSKYLIFGDNQYIHLWPLDPDFVYENLRKEVDNEKLSEAQWNYYKRGDLQRPE